MSHALIRGDEEEGEFGQLGDGDGDGDRRTRLLSRSVGPSLKNDEYKDVFFAVLFFVCIVIVTVLGLSTGVQALMSPAPDELVVSPVDQSIQTVHDDKQFSRASLLGGLLLISACSCAVSIGTVTLLCRFSKHVIQLCVAASVGCLALTGVWFLAAGGVAVGVVFCLLSLVGFLIYHFFLRSRLTLVATILHLAGEAVSQRWTLFFFGTLIVVAQLAFSLLWLLAVVGSATNESESWAGCVTYRYSGTYAIAPTTVLSCPSSAAASCQACVCDGGTRIASATGGCYSPKFLTSPFVGLLLVYVWVASTLAGIVHVGVAKTVSLWWSSSEGPPSELAVALGFRKAMTTNLGSICLGSLLVSIIQLARSACDFALRALKTSSPSASSSSSRVSRCSLMRTFALSCLSFALAGLDRAAMYFNRYALCYVALYDLTFIDASKAVVGLFSQRGLTLIVNDDLTENILSFAQVGVGITTVLLGWSYSSAVGLNHTDTLLICLCGYFVGAAVCGIAVRALVSASATILVSWAESPDAFGDAHPDLNILLQAAWGEVMRGLQPHPLPQEEKAAAAASLDSEAATAADLLSPQYVQRRAGKYAPPAPAPAPAPALAPRPFVVASEADFNGGGGDDDDDEEQDVLNIAPMQAARR